MTANKKIRAFLNYYYMHSDEVLRSEFTPSYFIGKIIEYDKTITHWIRGEKIFNELVGVGLLYKTENKNNQGEYLYKINKGVIQVIEFIQKGDA